MKKVTIEGTIYLGTLVKNSDETLTLKKAMVVSNFTLPKEEFMHYLQAKNLNELNSIEFGGKGSSYTVSKLTKDQKLSFKMVKLTMARAKALAAPTAENDMLGELLGK